MQRAVAACGLELEARSSRRTGGRGFHSVLLLMHYWQRNFFGAGGADSVLLLLLYYSQRTFVGRGGEKMTIPYYYLCTTDSETFLAGGVGIPLSAPTSLLLTELLLFFWAGGGGKITIFFSKFCA